MYNVRIVLSCVVARTYISERETHTQADTIASILLNFKPISALFAVWPRFNLKEQHRLNLSASCLFQSALHSQAACVSSRVSHVK